MTPATNYADLIAQLTAKQAAVGEVPTTPLAQEAFYETQTTIARPISVLLNASDLG